MNPKISLLTKNVLKRNNVSSLPVDVEAIAKNEGILISYDIFEDSISGLLYREGSKTVIGVNALHANTRQRFTIAHELGHYFLHTEGELFVDRNHILFRDNRASEGNYLQEREANKFAAEILMPKDLIIDEIFENEIDFEDYSEIEELAHKFGVSAQALTIRLTNLGIISFH